MPDAFIIMRLKWFYFVAGKFIIYFNKTEFYYLTVSELNYYLNDWFWKKYMYAVYTNEFAKNVQLYKILIDDRINQSINILTSPFSSPVLFFQF